MPAVGHRRPFDVRADGTVFGSGVGLWCLPLAAAIDAGDRIHAVIRGRGDQTTTDRRRWAVAPGRSLMSSPASHAVSGIDSSTVSYVECHGNPAPCSVILSKPGLRAAFEVSQTSRRSVPCVLGSVESKHRPPEVTGIAVLIKTIPSRITDYPRRCDSAPFLEPELRLTPKSVCRKASTALGVRRAFVPRVRSGRGFYAHVVLERPAVASEAFSYRAGWPSGNPVLRRNWPRRSASRA